MTLPTASVPVELVRLRLPGFRRPVHVLRDVDAGIVGGTWSGADPLLTRDGAVHAAHGRGRLLRDAEDQRRRRLQVRRVLVLDLVRCRRAFARPHQSWSGTVRGTVVDVDDLLWDAAAALEDDVAGEAVSAPDGFHAQYLYVWGDRPAPLPCTARLLGWDGALAWLVAHLDVVDRHDRRFADRR